MQLKNKKPKSKKLPILISAAATAVVSLGHAGSSDTVSLNHEYYNESDDRIRVDYTILDIKKDFGTDWSVSASFSIDEITGGTPIWDSISNPSPCTDEEGNYICDDKEKRPGNLIGAPQNDLKDFVYRNIEMQDTRKAGNISLTYRTPSRNEWSFGAAYSEESDFKSKEASIGFLGYLDETKNNSVSAGLSIQKNESFFYFDEEWKDMNIVSAEISYTQIFNAKTLGQVTLFGTVQSKALTNPYQTVIRRVNVLEDEPGLDPVYKFYRAREIRPDKKNILGVSFNFVSEVQDDIKIHAHYRLYKDDWDIMSHTLDFKMYYNITDKIVLAPSIRYYNQSAANFFKGHTDKDFIFSEKDSFASSDDRLGDFHSTTYALGIESKLTDKWDINMHGAWQKTSYDLKSYWVSLGVKYAF